MCILIRLFSVHFDFRYPAKIRLGDSVAGTHPFYRPGYSVFIANSQHLNCYQVHSAVLKPFFVALHWFL